MSARHDECRACGLLMRDLEHATFSPHEVYHTSCVEPLYEDIDTALRAARLHLIEGALQLSSPRHVS